MEDPFSSFVKERQHQGTDKWEQAGNSSWGENKRGEGNISTRKDADWSVCLKSFISNSQIKFPSVVTVEADDETKKQTNTYTQVQGVQKFKHFQFKAEVAEENCWFFLKLQRDSPVAASSTFSSLYNFSLVSAGLVSEDTGLRDAIQYQQQWQLACNLSFNVTHQVDLKSHASVNA